MLQGKCGVINGINESTDCLPIYFDIPRNWFRLAETLTFFFSTLLYKAQV